MNPHSSVFISLDNPSVSYCFDHRRRRSIHEGRLRGAQSAIDTSMPKTIQVVKERKSQGKTIQIELERGSSIDKDNRMLMGHLSEILQRRSRYGCASGWRDLTGPRRAQDVRLQRIHEENVSMLGRMETSRSKYAQHSIVHRPSPLHGAHTSTVSRRRTRPRESMVSARPPSAPAAPRSASRAKARATSAPSGSRPVRDASLSREDPNFSQPPSPARAHVTRPSTSEPFSTATLASEPTRPRTGTARYDQRRRPGSGLSGFGRASPQKTARTLLSVEQPQAQPPLGSQRKGPVLHRMSVKFGESYALATIRGGARGALKISFYRPESATTLEYTLALGAAAAWLLLRPEDLCNDRPEDSAQTHAHWARLLACFGLTGAALDGTEGLALVRPAASISPAGETTSPPDVLVLPDDAEIRADDGAAPSERHALVCLADDVRLDSAATPLSAHVPRACAEQLSATTPPRAESASPDTTHGFPE